MILNRTLMKKIFGHQTNMNFRSAVLPHIRSHQLMLIRSYCIAQEKERIARQSVEIPKKYWNSFRTVMTNPSKKSAINKILSTTGIGLVASYLYFTNKSSNAQVQKIVDIFEKGKIDLGANKPIFKKLIKREDFEKSLSRIIQPSSEIGNYFLIVGEYGTGKTTLVRNTILKLEKSKGVVHFECPSDTNDFSKKLANHLNCELYTFKFHDVIMQWITNAIRKVEQYDHSKYPSWNLLSMRLANASYYYMKKHNRPIVLIIDQIDRIAKRDPNFLSILQDFAKDHADRGSLIIVFIASEGLALQLLRSRSAWSRAIVPFEIGDIPDGQAVKYLQDFNINPKIAKHVVQYLTGGRFSLLRSFQGHEISKINPEKNSFEEFKKKLFWQIEIDLDMIKLPTNHKFFIKLNEVHCIKIGKAKSYIPIDMIHELVSANILKQYEDYTVSFHSRYVDTYFKEALQATT